MNNTTIQILQDLIGHATAGMEKAANMRNEYNAKQAEVESIIPDVVDALVSNQFVGAGEGMKVAQMLRHHDTTLHLLEKVATKAVRSSANSVGTVLKSAAPTKSATHDPYYDIYGL
ncbi:MAG: hypothetical protein Q4D38_00070 [Planctomycetia bacterium]|nr:hypothetical protein [Planctomycetia bacterium]